MAAKRAEKELQLFLVACETSEYGFAGGPVQGPSGAEDLFHWRVRLAGPPLTPYAGHAFWLSLSLPNDFPWAPPTITFRRPIWHGHVDPVTGMVQATAMPTWTIAWTMVRYLVALFELLKQPLLDGVPPTNLDFATMYRRSPSESEDYALARVLQDDEDHDSETD